MLKNNPASKLVLIFSCVAVLLLACQCAARASCIAGSEEASQAACMEQWKVECPDSLGPVEQSNCISERVTSNSLQYLEDSAAKNSNQNNKAVAPSSMNCNFLKLTSPLDGLPNGQATFYWDVLPNATNYRINIYDGGNYLTGFDSAAAATSLIADVSQGAIGGSFAINVELIAYGPNGQTCKQVVSINREAASGNNNSETSSNGDAGASAGAGNPPPNPCDINPNSCLK